MKEYMKPMISIDDGMAEGVYAAGSGSSIVSEPKNITNWDGNRGQATFTLDLSQMNRSQLTVKLIFNIDIVSGWGDGANATVSGNILTLNWYSAPTSANITIQVDKGITQIQRPNYSYSNK